MNLRIRIAVADDVDAVARLTAVARRRLAGWSPRWWRRSAAADQVHPLWLQHLIGNDGPIVRVAAEGDEIIGCVASMPQTSQWVVDDLAIANDERWDDAGIALVDAIAERPALHCAPATDRSRLTALDQTGLEHVSSYWIRDAEDGDVPTRPLPDNAEIPAPPLHTFGALDPHAEGALSFAGVHGGLVIGSPPITAPPVYDPGGTVAIIDRIAQPDDRLVRAALAASAQRGDVLVNVVTTSTDVALQGLLAAHGFCRTVDVYRWP
jgi:hypothetical protein